MFGTPTPERKLAVCTGGVELSGPERAEILAVLAMDDIEGVAQGAAKALMNVPTENFLAALAQEDAAQALMHYCAANVANAPGIADALAKNPQCPMKALEKAGKYLSTASIQSLLDNLERLSASPALIQALAAAPSANPEQRGLLAELQKGVMEAGELNEAMKAAEGDPTVRKTLLERLATMTVLDRVKLALIGGREERIVLIRDPNKVVQRCVLQSPRLTETEVESFAGMTTLTAEILRIIANNRLWIKNYTIVRNLIFNSKTPLDITLRQVTRLTPKDLRILSTSKSVPETLKTTAAKTIAKRNERSE